MSTMTSRARPSRGTTILSVATLAVGALVVGGNPPGSTETPSDAASGSSAATTLVPLGAAPIAVAPVAAVRIAGVRAAVPRIAVNIATSPYRFGSKAFNHWYALRYMAYKYGWNATQYRCLSSVWSRESAWNQRAHSRSGAHGIPQAMPGKKMAKFGRDWRTNPVTQIKWGLAYVRSVYKSPCRAWSFWQRHHWY